eukprot:1143792-Pelagomonas_calceolata.AAC.7
MCFVPPGWPETRSGSCDFLCALQALEAEERCTGDASAKGFVDPPYCQHCKTICWGVQQTFLAHWLCAVCHSLLLVDTEGFESTGRSTAYDDRVFAVSALLSSLLIYNLPEAIRESDIAKLSFAVQLAQVITSTAKVLGVHMRMCKSGLDWLRSPSLQLPLLAHVHCLGFNRLGLPA